MSAMNCKICEYHSKNGCTELFCPFWQPEPEPKPTTETCVTCGREIAVNTDCRFCLRGEYESAAYAADERQRIRDILEAVSDGLPTTL